MAFLTSEGTEEEEGDLTSQQKIVSVMTNNLGLNSKMVHPGPQCLT